MPALCATGSPIVQLSTAQFLSRSGLWTSRLRRQALVEAAGAGVLAEESEADELEEPPDSDEEVVDDEDEADLELLSALPARESVR